MKDEASNEIDRHVGGRLRMRRRALSMTQADLAEILGLSYQQVQKYECGANRIGAGRLWRMAEQLAVPISFFFEGLPESEGGEEPEVDRRVREFAASPIGAQALQALSRIDDDLMQQSIVTLLEQIVEGGTPRPDGAPGKGS